MEVLSLSGHENSEACTRWMLPRLQKYTANLHMYAAHKMQDSHQRAVHAQDLLNMDEETGVIIQVDYAAKTKEIGQR